MVKNIVLHVLQHACPNIPLTGDNETTREGVSTSHPGPGLSVGAGARLLATARSDQVEGEALMTLDTEAPRLRVRVRQAISSRLNRSKALKT